MLVFVFIYTSKRVYLSDVSSNKGSDNRVFFGRIGQTNLLRRERNNRRFHQQEPLLFDVDKLE